MCRAALGERREIDRCKGWGGGGVRDGEAGEASWMVKEREHVMGRRRSNIGTRRGMALTQLTACVGVFAALGGCAARSAEVSAKANDQMSSSESPLDKTTSKPLDSAGTSQRSGGMGDGTHPAPPPDPWARDHAAVLAAKAKIEASALALGLKTGATSTHEVGLTPPDNATPDNNAMRPDKTLPTPQPPQPKPQPSPAPQDPPLSGAQLEEHSGARCDTTCAATDGICASQRTICEIAGAHPLDPSFEVECVWASQVCERARARCLDCQAPR
jgi:hypothetical protein